MRHSSKLTFDTPDEHTFTPPLKMRGTRLLHMGNQKVYVIFDFAWDGARDEWNFLCKEEGNLEAVIITRPLMHITGTRNNGEKRYQILD